MKNLLLILIFIPIFLFGQSVTNQSSGVNSPRNITPYAIIDLHTGDTLSWYWNSFEIQNYVQNNLPDLSGYAPLNSPNFIGTPTSSTGHYGDNSTEISTNRFVYNGLPVFGLGTFSSVYPILSYTVVNSLVKSNSIIQVGLYSSPQEAQSVTPTYLYVQTSSIQDGVQFIINSNLKTHDSFYYFIWNHY